MAYITNGGARLIERARLEGKSLVFGSVRMNTIFEPTPDELVYRSDEWFGANVGEVVGCLSHVSVDDVSCVCDSKLAVQCNDNSEAWKSMGIYAHLEGEVDDLLFACESIQNGEYKDVTIVELPVTLDGVVADFGLSEGGGSGGGGGSEDGSTAPLTGEWQSYSGEGSVEDPVGGDRQTLENLSVGGGEASIVLERRESQFNGEEGIWGEGATTFLRITPGGVSLNEYGNESGANWSDIINAASIESGVFVIVVHASDFEPSSEFRIGPGVIFETNGESQITSVRTDGVVLDVSVAILMNGGGGYRLSGIISSEFGLSFDSPITPEDSQTLFIHWTRMR